MFKKKLLNKAIMATVLGGMMLAPSFALALTITGTAGENIDNVTVGKKNSQKNIKNVSTNYVSYDVKNAATIAGIVLDGTEAKAYISGSKKSLTIENHSGAGEQTAVNVCNGGDLYTMTTNATNILTLNLGSITSTDGIAYGYKIKDSNGWIAGIRNITSVNGAAGAYGLYADNSWVTDYVSAAQLFKIGNKNDETISYGVSSSANGSDKAAGIYADNNSQVLIQKLEEYVKGNGVVAKGGSKVALGSDKSGTVTVYVDKTNTDDYAALLADGDSSQIDVGLKDTWKTGTFTFGAISNGYQDNINGNVVVKNNGTVNLSLTNAKSTWDGVAYNNGGTVNLWLQNGAIWTNDKWGDQTGFNGSHITKLTGGSSADNSGIIFQKDANPLTIDNYSGNTKVFYAHTNDGDEASDYAGDIKINSANAGTSITLITDKTGIDMANNTAVEAALMALSGKLYYLGYTTGEDNLAGYVQIAEGLTASSAMLKAGNIAFDNSTGKGSYEPDVYKTAQTKFALGNMITGVENNDKAYKKAGILREDGKYHFDDDTVITNNGTGSDYSTIINNGPITIEGEGKKLTLNVTGDATRIQAISQVGISNPITINVDTLKIDVSDSARTEGILATNQESQTEKPVLTVNGNVDLKLRAGGTAAFGLHVYSYAGINITGDVAIKGDGTGDDKWGINAYGTNGKTIGNSYFGNAAIHVQSQMQNNYSGSIVIGGDVDVLAQAAGLYINGGSGVIEIKGGGKIEIDPTVYASAAFGDAVYGAMRSELGYIYMNVVKDSADGVKGNVTGAGTKQVNILGNVIVSRGADNASLAPDHLNSIINLGLSTADSTWKGVAYNAYSNAENDVFTGEINLWLQNGATWTNELYGVTGNPYSGLKFSGNEGDKAVYDGSRINKLVGGSSAANSGIIFQKDANPLTIDNYSGNTKVFYAHINDGDEASDYAAGDITIKAAATGSAITLITDNSNIDTGNKVLTDKVLNALAGKLYYTAYTTGEDNLSGVVQIAEGLTSASATLVTSEMMFKAATGQGMLKMVSLGTQITNDKTTNQEYVDLNILRDDDKYHFDKDFLVDVKDLTGGANLAAAAYGADSLDLELADNTTLTLSASGSGKLFTIDAKNGLLVNGGTNSKLVLDLLSSGNAYGGINMTADDNTKVATINTDVDISVKSSGTGYSGYALGIYASKGTMNINGKLTMKNRENPGVTNISGTEPDYYGWIDVYSTNGAVVNLKTVDIISGGEGLYANNGGSVINVDGGSIVHLKNNSKYYALRAAGATINMNMNGDKTAPANNKVVIKGNITTQSDWVNKNSDNTKDTVINLGLTTSASSLTGVAYNVFGNDGIVNSEKTFRGGINMWLQNGATWNNENWSTGEAMKGTYGGEEFAGSHLAKLVGGSSAANSGIIFQKDANPLTIDSYSGNTKFIFSHNNSGTAITDYSAGDIIIKHAASGSNISLITDNQGINTSNTTVVDNVLGALARKLYYTAYVGGERNLTGSVGIAEGLTGGSVTLFSDNFEYIAETGQGVYKDIVPPVEPVDPTPAVVSSDVLTGTMKDKAFLDDKITSAKNIVKYDLTDKPYSYKSLNAAENSKAVIDVGDGNAIYFDGKTSKNLGIVLNDGANVTINGNVNVSSYSESYDAAGIAMIIGGTGIGKKTDLTINGKVTMGSSDAPGVVAEDKHGAYGFYAGTRWTGAAINMNMGHGSTINITDGLTAYVDGHGIVTDPYYCDKKYADKDLAVVTVNGPTTIHVGSDEDVGLYALANYGGTININMKNGQPGTDKVDIFGNAIVMKDTMGESENPYFYRSGEINLALTTADSLWIGAVDNTGTTQVGDFNLYLQNGGTWNYQNASKMDGLSASTMPTPSISYYGVYDGVSHIAKLTGGSDAASRGVIMINSDDTLAIANYSGNVLVAYEHDEVNPTTIYGGDIKIAKAKVGSVITLFTNNVGVDGSNYTAVLNALAGKLYYTGGDEALIGQVQIGEGLTSQSVTYEGYIAYGANGQGKYTSEKGTTVVNDAIGADTENGAFKVEETDDAKTIKMDDKPKMVSVETGSALKNSGDKPLVIDNSQATLVLQSADKTSPVVAADKGDVKIKGAVEVIGVPGQKLMDVAEGKKMDLAGGEFTAVPDPENPGNPPVALELAKNAVVSIGMPVEPAQSGALAPKPLPVKLTGDIQNTEGTLNLKLATADSFWKGNYQNKDAELNVTIDNKDAKWEGKVNGATLNVDINAGTWVNKGESKSSTNNFTLNAGGVKKAFVDMTQGSGNITIDNYSGGMTLIYNNEENTPTTINGGTVTIKSAAENSVVNLWTDGKGLDLTTEVGYNVANDDKVKEVLNELAKKLTYEGYKTEGHITGEVGVGEALTRPAITFPKAAALVFVDGENGKGSIDASTFKDNIPHGEVVYGDSETAMMRGAKMAMASTAMIWRAEANDLTKRMGDLQLRKEEAGVWAKYYSGRQEYNNNGSFSNKYKAVQVGVDKSLGHGWLGGIALSYDAGNGSLSNGGSSDNKVQSLGFYGTKVNKNGEYVDLIGKFSRLENEYTIYNDYGYSLDGDYKNFGMSVSAEYGKHIKLKNGLVLTPAVEFTLGRVNSKNYDAYSEYYEKSMTVKQDAFNSAIGRIGVSIGKETATYSYYAKLGLAHEFAGGFDTTYSAPGEPTSGTSINFKDTWKEVQIGGSVKLKNDALLYGSFSKSFGGDVTEKWRIDAGMMFTFNHISDFFGGRKKTEAAAVVAETPTANLIETTAPVEEKNYTAETAAVADANGDRNASVKVGDTEVGATMPTSKISKGAFMLDEYVVTASRTKQRITDAKADVSVVTRTEIEAMHMNSVEEALRTVPGVQFNNYGSGNQMNANISSLRINGSKDVALLVDGVKINDFQGVGESGNMYAGVLNNMNNIERIEVLRGAAGVLYGSGAKGGVINIITREITENKTIADASVGSFGRKDTKFSTMGKAGKLTYNFSQGTFKQGDVTDGNGDKWEGHTNTHNFGGKVTYSFTDNHKLTLDYMDINSNFGGTDLIYSNYYNGKYESTMWSIRDDWQINKNWSNTFVYRQNEEKRQHQQQYFAGNVLKNSDTDFKYTFISDQISFHNNRHNLVMGVDYSQGEDQNYTLVNGRNVKREMKNTSFYISEDWTIVPHVTLSGGLRHDRPKEDKYGSKIDSHTTKSYKLAWDVTKKDTVYAGRSEYFILPSMSQLYDKEWGNEGLKPAEGRTESIGYNKKFDDNNFLTVNYFQTKENCGIGWNGYNRVNTSGISRGWNAQFTSRLSDKWSFNVGWSHLYERSDGDDNYTLGYYPRDLATFGVYYNVGKFDAGLDGYWFFRRKDDSGRREFPADNYGIYNLSMNYKPTKNMKMYCKVENIFNKYYAEHTDAGTDPYLTGTGERKYYAMPGRAFMVGLEFNF